MADLEYSVEASNILNKFHSVDVMLYVEGVDDIPFWEFVFEKLSDITVKVQQVGGKPNLEKYANEVFEGKLNSIVAMDSDFSVFDDGIIHPNILRTFGYSIENTMINDNSIQDVIRSIGRIPRKDIPIEICSDWLNDVASKVEYLVAYDVENHVRGHGISVVGDNCSRFIKGKSSPVICPVKVSAYIDAIGFELLHDDFEKIRLHIMDNNFDFLDFIRGHFLFSATQHFVSSTISEFRSKVSISLDSLFGALMLAFEKRFSEGHPHYHYYKAQVSNVVII